jgi:ribosomal protein L21E
MYPNEYWPKSSISELMNEFSAGDQVRIDIPDVTDPDYDRYHGQHGRVVATLRDDAQDVTGDKRDSVLYRVELKSGERADFRWRNLRPPIE